MKKSRFVREMTGWKRHNHNAFLSSSALVNEDWNVNGDWNFAGNVSSDNPISAADPVDADDLVTLGYFETHAGLYQGVLDASAGIAYPAASEGMYWRISVAGVIGTTQVEVGDQVIAIADYVGGMDDTKFMIVQTNVQVTSVTYAQLRTLINNAGLEPGRQYLISDYVTAFNLFDGGTNTVVGNEVGSQEPLLVKAVTTSTLDRVAQSWLYPQDIIYYNPYASAVDRAAFIAAGDVGYIDGGDVVPNFKGVIEFRHDTKQNVSTWYDFRNIKFRRWAVDAVAYDNGTAYVARALCKGSDGKIYKCITATTGEGDPTVNTADWISWLDITLTSYVSWTADITKLSGQGNCTSTNLILKADTYQDVYTFGSYYSLVYNVIIGKNIYTTAYKSSLNNIAFETTNTTNTCSNVTIGNDCYLFFIGSECYKTSFGDTSTKNIISKRFSDNTVSNSFSQNMIGYMSTDNYLQSSFTKNVAEIITYNRIESGFTTCNLKSGFSRNIIEVASKVNAGTSCSGIYVGAYNTQINLGDNCTGISIGEKNGTITLGATNTDISIGNGNTAVTIGDDCIGCTIGNGNEPIVFGASNSNIFVGNGNVITIGASCLSIDIGESNTITLGEKNTNISIGNGNPTITTGDNCTNLTFQNGCTFSGNTAPNGLQNNIFKSGTNITATDFTSATFIKAAYNTTVFMNATPAVKLSYFDASNALTVVNVNA